MNDNASREMQRPDTDAMRRWLEKITPGDWQRGIGSQSKEVSDPRGLLLATVRNANDGSFVANAPTYVRQLLAYIELLEFKLEKTMERVDQLTEEAHP